MRSAAESRTARRVEEPDPTIPDEAQPPATNGGGRPSVHRLRDLGPRDRLIALALGLVLLVAPVSSAVRQFGTWSPAGDDALIEIRARDAGTSRTPLIGQPSSSSLYGQRERNAAHPGPIEFYLLAPAERLIGGGMGVLSTIAVISGASVVVAAWAMFRQLGRGAGMAAAIALAAVMWTSGAAAIVDPRSSAVGRFPLLCSVVLVWCLVCGDIRLLPLTCLWLSFTMQQHLSIVPVTGIITVVGLVGLGVAVVRQGGLRDGEGRRTTMRSVLLAAVVGLVLWFPVLYEQFTRSPGNLTRIARYAGDKSRSDVGYGAAFRQVAHALGLPPLLGRINVTGPDLLAPVSLLTRATAVVAVVLLIVGGVVWRRRNPRLTALVVVAAAVAVGGLFNGANVPNSLEQIRIAFYHWAFTLAFLEFLILLLAVGPPVWRWLTEEQPDRSVVLQGLAGPLVCLLVLAPAVGNLIVHRTDNRLLLLVPKSSIDQIESEVRSHARAIHGPTLVMSTDRISFTGTYEAVAARLVAAGLDVKFPQITRDYVADDRLVDYRTVRSAIVVAFGVGGPPTGIPGKLIATAAPAPGLDTAALALLIREARAGSKVVLGPAVERVLARQSKELLARPGLTKLERATLAGAEEGAKKSLRSITKEPEKVLTQLAVLRWLVEAPLIEPALNHQALERVLRTYPVSQGVAMSATHLSLYLLDRRQLLAYAPPP